MHHPTAVGLGQTNGGIFGEDLVGLQCCVSLLHAGWIRHAVCRCSPQKERTEHHAQEFARCGTFFPSFRLWLLLHTRAALTFYKSDVGKKNAITSTLFLLGYLSLRRLNLLRPLALFSLFPPPWRVPFIISIHDTVRGSDRILLFRVRLCLW